MFQKRTVLERSMGISFILASLSTCAAGYWGLPDRPLRQVCIVVIWLLWCGTTCLFPIAVLKSGKLRHKLGDVDRLAEPGRFWMGLTAYSALLFFGFAVASVICWHSL
jgi:hypothetical protein